MRASEDPVSEANPVREEILRWLAESVPLERQSIEALLDVPPSAQMGDYVLPCFALASELKRPPAEIASELAGGFVPNDRVLRAAAAGPYLNFFVNRPLMTSHVLRQVHELGADYGKADSGAGKNVVIDYSSPNIAKHLGVHHLRSALIGRSLYRIFEALGYNCVGINHLGDWGTSFGKLIAAFERYGDVEAESATVSQLQELYVRFSREADQRPELQDQARRAFQRLEGGEAGATELWKRFKATSVTEFERIYRMLGISFDSYAPESFYLEMTDEVLRRMKQSGLARESEDALIVPLDDYGLPPYMLRKADETTLYATRDICAAEYRWRKYRFHLALYVVGGEQELYFRQLKKVLELMGHQWAERVEHVGFGLLKFRDAETGLLRTGSTRQGEMIPLEEVLRSGVEKARQKIRENLDKLEGGADPDELAAQVGIGAVVFSDLSVKRAKDVVFDWDRMLDFEGDTGPYVQYAHARLCSIMRKAGEEVSPEADCEPLQLPEEWALVRLLERFPSRLRAAAEGREPSMIANYLLELCAQFSAYYSAGMREAQRRVLCGDEATRAARLLLVSAVRHTIRNGLALLGVAAPERM